MVVCALALPAAMNERLDGDRTIAPGAGGGVSDFGVGEGRITPLTVTETNALCEFVSLIVMLQCAGARRYCKGYGCGPICWSDARMVPALGLHVSLSVSVPV